MYVFIYKFVNFNINPSRDLGFVVWAVVLLGIHLFDGDDTKSKFAFTF